MFDKIQNPQTGRWVKTTSSLGKKILNQYKNQVAGGNPNHKNPTEWEEFRNIANGKNAYQILNIKRDTSPKDIKKAYRKLILANHPDRVSESEKDKAVKITQLLNESYAILYDDDKGKYREAYDNWLKFSSSTKPTPAPAPAQSPFGQHPFAYPFDQQVPAPAHSQPAQSPFGQHPFAYPFNQQVPAHSQPAQSPFSPQFPAPPPASVPASAPSQFQHTQPPYSKIKLRHYTPIKSRIRMPKRRPAPRAKSSDVKSFHTTGTGNPRHLDLKDLRKPVPSSNPRYIDPSVFSSDDDL